MCTLLLRMLPHETIFEKKLLVFLHGPPRRFAIRTSGVCSKLSPGQGVIIDSENKKEERYLK